MRRDMNKSEIRGSKSETIPNDQNPNDQNNRTCTFQVSPFSSFENSNLSSFVSSFDIRYSDLSHDLSPRIGRTSPGPPPEVEGLDQKLYGVFLFKSVHHLADIGQTSASLGIFLSAITFSRLFFECNSFQDC